MRRLPEPYAAEGPAFVGDILAECAAGYRDAGKRNKILSCRKAVEDASAAYRGGMPGNIADVNRIAHDRMGHPELADLYREKFVPNGGRGRKYYETIINSGIESGECPVCGIGNVSQLDHYLPKSDYPLLSVTPANLVPVCSSCNGFEAKGAYSPKSLTECLYHPYFEDPPNCIWLRAEIDYSIGPCVTYGVEQLDDDVLHRRLLLFMDVYGLGGRYGSIAVGALNSERRYLSRLLDKGESKELKDYLVNKCSSAEAHDRNDLYAALWRAALRQLDETAQWVRGAVRKTPSCFSPVCAPRDSTHTPSAPDQPPTE